MVTSLTSISDGRSSLRWTVISTVFAVCGVIGSLWLTLGMNLKACPLCLYQRAFMMSAAAVLLIGILTEIRHSLVLPLLALPAVVAGLGVAGFHEYLEQTGKLECPLGLFGIGTAPQQSLAAFVALFAVLMLPQFQRQATGARPMLAGGAVLLGLLLAIGTIKSAPPMPAAPGEPYKQSPDICRPPYRPAAPEAEGRP